MFLTNELHNVLSILYDLFFRNLNVYSTLQLKVEFFVKFAVA